MTEREFTDLDTGRGNSLNHGSHCSDRLGELVSLGACGREIWEDGDGVHQFVMALKAPQVKKKKVLQTEEKRNHVYGSTCTI